MSFVSTALTSEVIVSFTDASCEWIAVSCSLVPRSVMVAPVPVLDSDG